nr:glycosyltransferase family 2 protein [Candidatus Sigynarchaeota archaeon]
MTVTQKLVHVEGIPAFEAKQKSSPRIVVLIPAYNEEKGIRGVVKQVRSVLASITDDFDILVIDDDSSDKTREILDGLEVNCFFHRKNLGKGDVIKNVLDFLAPDEIVVTIDGDGEHDASDLPRLIKPILADQADIVIGSRFLATDAGYLGREKNTKFVKNFGNKFFSILLWIFTRKTVHDTQSGYRAFRARKVKRLNLCSDGFRIEMEMTVKALRRGYRVTEVAINNGQGHRKSHLKIFPDGVKIAMTVLRECLPRVVKRFLDWLLPRFPERLGKLIS